MLAECEQRGHTLSRLRLHLTKRCQQTSAALLWLMAIKAEAVLPAGSHRVQVQPAVLCCAVPCCAVLCLADDCSRNCVASLFLLCCKLLLWTFLWGLYVAEVT